MFLDKKQVLVGRGVKSSLLSNNNNFVIIDFIPKNRFKNLIFYYNIKQLRVGKIFFKADYYMSYKEEELLDTLELFDAFITDIFISGIMFKNQYLNVNNDNLEGIYQNLLFIQNNFLYLYKFFFSIFIVIINFLRKIFSLISKLC